MEVVVGAKPGTAATAAAAPTPAPDPAPDELDPSENDPDEPLLPPEESLLLPLPCEFDDDPEALSPDDEPEEPLSDDEDDAPPEEPPLEDDPEELPPPKLTPDPDELDDPLPEEELPEESPLEDPPLDELEPEELPLDEPEPEDWPPDELEPEPELPTLVAIGATGLGVVASWDRGCPGVVEGGLVAVTTGVFFVIQITVELCPLPEDWPGAPGSLGLQLSSSHPPPPLPTRAGEVGVGPDVDDVAVDTSQYEAGISISVGATEPVAL